MKIRAGLMVVAMLAATAGNNRRRAKLGSGTYKAKCQSCHGAEGTPNPGIAKMMGVKPVSDPSVKSLSEATMIADTTNGKGKMPAFKGKLTDAQIKDSVAYFRPSPSKSTGLGKARRSARPKLSRRDRRSKNLDRASLCQVVPATISIAEPTAVNASRRH